MARQDPIEQQFEMFEATALFLSREKEAVMAGLALYERLGCTFLAARGVRLLRELAIRTGQLNREYQRWTEQKGIADAVQEFLWHRHKSTRPKDV